VRELTDAFPTHSDLVMAVSAGPTGDVLALDPLSDPRWDALVKRHPRASVFHTPAWLEVLRHTYGYRPIAYALTSSTKELRSAVLLCEIKSWLTGKRLVSLPFSDHCEPLVDGPAELQRLLAPATSQVQKGLWRYLELRPLSRDFSKGIGQQFEHYILHRLDLRQSIEALYKNLHVDSIRRKIQKAEKKGFAVETGVSEALLAEFYDLHVATRRRQSAPPHPLKWFRNVLWCLGKNATLRIARSVRTPVAAVLTLEKGSTLVYKYGCSDARFHNLGAMPFVFWNMICDAKSRGILELDMGRSELENTGLIAFKDKWGALRQELIYTRDPLPSNTFKIKRVQARAARFVFSRCPDWALIAAGNLLYPHVG
jgi:lipid II:glycine glycyltransferase (peptidoglycan interpeptide bridge formation enzyme)